MATFMTDIAVQRLQRAVEELTEAIEVAATQRNVAIEDLLEEIGGRPELRALLSAAVDTASGTEDDYLRRLAARLLKEGLTDNDAVDECRLLLATLRQLEPVHLRVFALIAGSQLHPEGLSGKSVEMPMTIEALEEAWPPGRFVLPAVLAVLEGVGLIREDMFSRPPSQPRALRTPGTDAAH